MGAKPISFLGRSAELAVLERELDEAIAGRGRVTLIAGEPGIGKTRLADELAAIAVTRGARVAWGRAWEGEGAPPLFPWIQVARALGWDPLDVFEREGAPRTPESRFASLDQVAHRLRVEASRGPMVIVLDDLHWADEGTLLLARLVARDARSGSLLLIGTYRDGDLRVSNARMRAVADIARDGRTSLLQGLPPAASFGLVLEEIPAAGEAWLTAIHERTRGNPFFLGEIVRSVAAAPGSLGAPLPIPDGVRVLVRGRLAGLSPLARTALDVASVLGSESTLAQLVRATKAPALALRGALREAESLRIVIERSAGTYAFEHDLVRDAVYEDLDVEARTTLHEQIAVDLGEGGRDEDLGEALRHLRLALAPGDPRVVDLGRRAGAHALSIGAFESAAEHLGHALEALDHTRESDLAMRGALTVELAEARLGAGDVRAGREAADRAREIARSTQASGLLARAALAYASPQTLGRVELEAVARLEEALGSIDPHDVALSCALEARLAAALQPASDPERPLGLARGAIARARTTGDPRLLASTLHAARAAFRPLDDLGERHAMDVETERLAVANGDRVMALHARGRLASDLLEQGDLHGAHVWLSRYELDATALRIPQHVTGALAARAMHATMAGLWEEATALVRAARVTFERWRELGTVRFPTGVIGLHRGALLRARGQYEEPDDLRPMSIMGAVGTLILGGVEGGPIAEATLREAYEGALLECRSLPNTFTQRVLLAEACVRLRDVARAPGLYALLTPLAGRAYVWTPVAICEGSIDRLLGLLARTMGKRDQAIAHLEAGLVLERALGARPFAAQTQWALAGELLERGVGGDLARAEAMAREAEETFRALDMPAFLSLTQTRVAPRSLAAPSPLLMAREGDTWTLTFRGQSARLKDADGLHYIAYLVVHPDEEIGAEALLGTGPRARPERPEADAGPLLDAAAKAAYRRRLAQLGAERDEAERWGDLGRLERLSAETEALNAELSRAVGLGGRSRKALASSERARVNVTMRIRKAIERVELQAPAIAHHLATCIRTGGSCAYRPPPSAGE